MIRRRIKRTSARLRRGSIQRFQPTTRLTPELRRSTAPGKIRYAVVGLGHIAQSAVLPAFRHATKNSQLMAVISDDPTKRRELTARYRIPLSGSYEQYDELLHSGDIDAVYIAVPNSLHRDFAVGAARAGVHVLCEKPLAVSVAECQQIIDACRRCQVKLMTAYRLHFEKSNLEAIRVVQSGKIGEPRFFNSIFSMQARPGNIRLRKKLGGGPLFDLGVYCINAARYLFRAEPVEVQALSVSGDDPRFREVEESAGAVLRFPNDRLATFVCSFGAADSDEFHVVGTKGALRLNNGYEYAESVEMKVTANGASQTRRFEQRDQFAPELVYFSDCILKNREPEPSGEEGLNDVRVIEAIFESARKGAAIPLPARTKRNRPTTRQEIRRPAIQEPDLVRAKSGSRD